MFSALIITYLLNKSRLLAVETSSCQLVFLLFKKKTLRGQGAISLKVLWKRI
jgi:hypothetical protein